MTKLFALLFALWLTVSPLQARAGWDGTTLQGYASWVYTPATTMANGKRALLLLLHGCAQGNDALRQFGNLEASADNNALVLALPDVGWHSWYGNPFAKCWDYDGARDLAGNMADMLAMVAILKADPALNIDPRQVYVAGLSSGAALALDLACRAPDVFAGVGAIAAPSVGSDQFDALREANDISPANTEHALASCRQLAGGRNAHFATQIAAIAYGAMDLNGPSEGVRYGTASDAERNAHAGQLALVSIRWSNDNAAMLDKLYGTGPPAAAQPVQGGLASASIARRDTHPRVALVQIDKVGHAWPAGSGRPNAPPADGVWIAQSGLNFLDYLASWFTANNLRVHPGPGPALSLFAAPGAAASIEVSGAVRSADGGIARVSTVLLRAPGNEQVASHPHYLALQPDGSFSERYTNVAPGHYRIQASALDAGDNLSLVVSDEIVTGPQPPTPACITDNNYQHVKNGRARQCGTGFACAVGSDEALGLYSLSVRSSLVEDPPGSFHKSPCGGP